MKNHSWKLVGAIALVGSLVVLLAFTVHLVRSTSAANRELDALRGEVARQQTETASRQAELLAPIAARVSDLSESLKEHADALADIGELGTRLSKLEAEAPPLAQPTAQPALQPTDRPSSQPSAQVEAGPVTPSAAQIPAESSAQTSGELSTQPSPEATAAATALTEESAPGATADLEPKASSAETSATVSSAEERGDKGRFLVLQTGNPVGVESFDLRGSETGYTLTSSIQKREGTRGTEFAQTLTLTAGWQPTGYTLTGTVDGAVKHAEAAFQDGRLVLAVSGTRVIDEAVQTGPAIVTFGWAAPSSFAVIYRALGADIGETPREATALCVDRQGLVPMRLQPRTPIKVSTPGGEDIGYGYEVGFGEEVGTAWYYVQNDVVIAVAVPSQGLFAYREDLFPRGLSVTPRTLVAIAAPLGVVEFGIQFANRGATLKGTFTIPYTATEKMPAVLLLPDLGPYDRDGDAVGLETKILRDLALRLGQQGVASLRFDPRGIGESAGEFSTLTLDELETDALVALITLRANPRIDTANVFVVGYGYGGLVAQRLGARSSAAGAACIAMPARALADHEVDLARRRAEAGGFSPEEVKTLVEREQAYWQFVRSTHGTWADVGWKTAQAALPWMGEMDYMARSRSLPLPLLRDVLDKDPVAAVRALQKKTLFVQGKKDFVVPMGDIELLVQAARDAGNQEALGETLDELNHWLREQPEPAPSLDGHLDEETSWNAIAAVLEWIAPPPPLPEGGKSGPAPAS